MEARERAVGSKLAKDQEEDVGSTDGDEELADSKFHDMRKEEEAAYREAAAGAMRDILAQCALGDEETKQMNDELKRTERKKAAKRRASKKKGDDEAEPQKKKRRALFEEVEDPLSSGDDSAESFTPRRQRRTHRRTQSPKPSRTSNTKTLTRTPVKEHGDGDRRQTPVKGDPREELPEEDDDAVDGGSRGPGRRPKECRAIASENWKKFQTADEKTIFSASAATCKGVC